ncbi:hypothetical protein IAQ61_007516 [Plenodomus lingam]|uniref:uncharacterized protein n=1 Tax=Leptosphaeria maculans TaxID=5022 RepID=UPI003327E650|nr:hypothetical protein IAQ61_007516 [Plenodomus lingam]
MMQAFKAYLGGKPNPNEDTIQAKLYTLGKDTGNATASIEAQNGKSDTPPKGALEKTSTAAEPQSGAGSKTVIDNKHSRFYPGHDGSSRKSW